MPIYLSDLQIKSRVNDIGACFAEYVPDPDIRLVAGKQANEGRVEIRHKGEFGTVCHDGFGEEEAQVVCRMLGYEYVMYTTNLWIF